MTVDPLSLEEIKTKLFMMTNEDRIEFLDMILDQPIDDSTLRFKLIELTDLKKKIKVLESELKPFKFMLTETMKGASLGEFEITDGLFINLRKGSQFYRVSYKDIEKEFPEILDQIRSVIKTTTVKDTYTTKYRDEGPTEDF